MMKTKIGINGFGRIGRSVLREIFAKPAHALEVVAINDIASAETLAHLLKYDSVHGIFSEEVRAEDSFLFIGSQKIQVLNWKNPAESDWSKFGTQVVLECSGIFTDKEKASGHLKGSVKKVIVSAPGKGVDLTVVLGVNEKAYKPSEHHIISNASCTTNCLAPVIKVLHDNFQVKRGFMTTVHSYTNDQKILDVAHKDLRRARAAALSQIPTTTGAAKAIGLVIPELKGKIDGLAIRVPTPNVSLVDFVGEVTKSTTVEEVNAALKSAAAGHLKGILDYTESPLVSIDFNGNPHSSTIDALSTSVIEGTLIKVISWYDNETGFSRRMVDVTELLASQL